MDEISEYKALRATIRERGTFRVCAVLAGLAVWAALLAGLAIADVNGPVRLVSLIMLAATYEVNFFIHTGVERVGRYIQVFYEEAGAMPRWETTAMNYGAKFPGGVDPLFATLFHLCNATNFLGTFPSGDGASGWIALALACHATLAYRIVSTKRAAATQRAHDLERFRSLARG